ncbi:maleylpyruvate isomerase N-terminal domain-containing protein [Spirillospora sp. NPDC048819]|uniref:maleylpyruvate isomerase N-terminal domain-containing protein n=1 Tax=Spirillospora sp. NPDC048819 TaxID=3155268 RepID=UPI0033F254BE
MTDSACSTDSAGSADSAGRPGPSTRVPTCPEWTLQDLVGHVGGAHRWVTHLIRTGGTDAAKALPGTVPDDPRAWHGWLRDGVEDLIAAYEANPDGTVEHPLLGTWPTVRWLRRMTHETSIHHADAAFTAGRPFALADDLAADGISECLELLSNVSAVEHKPGLAELRGRGETVFLRPARLRPARLRPAERSSAGWLITRTPEGPVWEREDGCGGGGAAADVTVAGPVRDLLLVLARRLTPDDAHEVKVTGDRSLLDHWLTHTAV